MSNTFGRLFRVTTFGESHGPAMGCVIDGCPAGLELSLSDIEKELARRRPGAKHGSRDEQDIPEILSGVFEGKTLGTPIAIIVKNTNQNSADYDYLKDLYRPGHADFTYEAKYGFRDHRGGGRSSGRETLCRVAAGAVAKKLLSHYGIEITAWAEKIAGLTGNKEQGTGNNEQLANSNEQIAMHNEQGTGNNEQLAVSSEQLAVSNEQLTIGSEQIRGKLEKLRGEGDSVGGVVNCVIRGVNQSLPAGLGEPVFDKLDARLAAAIMGIGACKGIEFGTGFKAAGLLGSENNAIENSGGGILGGISNGSEISFRAAFKPTPSISIPQMVKTKDGSVKEISITGRHDVCIVPRVIPVVEAMAALVLADFLLLSRNSRI